jgi:ECF transporter S component (folate family)
LNSKTYKLVSCGLLIALSVILTRVFSANFLIVGVPAGRLATGFVPIMLAGLLLGPYYGLGAGALADIIGYLIFPSGVYFPLITLTSALVGLLPALISRWMPNLREWQKTLLAVAVTQIVCSMFLQTFFLSMLYGKAFTALLYPRIVVTLITIPVYFAMVHAILSALRRANLMPAERRLAK